MSKHFNLAVDADGIALITMDSPGRSMNVLGPDVEPELAAIVDQIVGDAAIRGAIITSGKPSFIAGYDLTEFLRSFGPQLTPVQVYENFSGPRPPAAPDRDLRQAVRRGHQRPRARRRLRSCASPAITA